MGGEVDAEIFSIRPESGTYSEGDSVWTSADVQNTDDISHTFFVGYSVHGPDGGIYDNNDSTGQTVSLDPGEWQAVDLEWIVESDAPDGEYDVQVALWEESDRDNLHTRLDEEWDYSAFDVESEEIDGQINWIDPSSGTYLEDESIWTSANVENTGNTDHTFFVGYTVHGPDGSEYDNDDGTGQTVTLDPDESETVDLEWVVESDAPDGDYDVQVALWEESDRDNLHTRLDEEWDYSAFDVESEEIDGRIDWISPDSGVYREAESVETTANVENTGNTNHTYFVGYTVHGPNGEEYDNDGETGRTVSLNPGESRSVDLEWTVELDAPGGEYDVQVALWEESDRDNLHTRLDEEREYSTFEVEGEEVNGRINWISPDSGTYSEDDSVWTNANVENTGNVRHTFFIGYSIHGPDGGTYDNDDETGQTVTLDPQESETVDLEWVVESDVPDGSYDVQVALWEESDRNDLHTRLNEEWEYSAFEIEAEKEINGQVNWIDPSSGKYSEDESVWTTVDVENTGDESHSFFVGYTVHGPDGEEYDNDGETGQAVTLDPNESDTVDLEWDVESDVPDGEYDVQVALWEESDRDDLHTRLDEEWDYSAFEIEVEKEFNGQVNWIDPSSGTYSEDESVWTSANVENTGNTDHTFFVGYTVHGPDGSEYDNGDGTGQTVTLEPDESATVDLEWIVESDVPDGEYDVQVAVWEESDRDDLQTRLDEEWEYSAFEIEAEKEINGQVNSISPENGTYNQGEVINTSADVENTGYVDHSFFVEYTVHSPDGEEYNNGGETGQEVSIPSGESTTVELEWTVESDAPDGEYDVQVTLWEENDRDDLQTRLDEEFEDGVFEITSQSSLDYTVEARDARGRSIDGAEVSLSSTEKSLSATTTAGETTFRDVDQGEYQLIVESSQLNQLKSAEVYIHESQPRHRVVFDPAQPVHGAVIDTENWQLGTEIQIGISDFGASPTTNQMGIYKTEERIPHGEVSVTTPTSTSIRHDHGEMEVLDIELGDAPADDGYISTSVEEVDTLTSLVLQYAQTAYDYSTKLLSGLHGFVRGLISGFQEMVDAFTSLADVIGAILSLSIWDVIEIIISIFSDFTDNLRAGFQYLISAIMGIPDKYWETSESLADKQDEDNRFDHSDDRYMPFALGWFGGYSVTGLIIGGAIARGASAARSVLNSMDTFEDATSAASRYLRRSGDSDSVSPGQVGTFQNTKPQWYSDRTDGLTIRGSYMDIGIVKETIESVGNPQLFKEFVTAAHYRNHWSRGKDDPKDPADDRRNAQNEISGHMKGNVNEEVVGASLHKSLDINRIEMNRNDINTRDITADHIWNSFRPAQLQPGESVLIRNFEPDQSQIPRGLDFELDYVRVVGRQQDDGSIVPVVTHVIEPTASRRKSADPDDPDSYRADKNHHIDEKIPELVEDGSNSPGTNLNLEAFYREGSPRVVLIKTQDNEDPHFDGTLQATEEELIEVGDALKTASRDGSNPIDQIIMPPDIDD